MPVRIIGIGSPFGDDRVGWAAVEALEASGLTRRLPHVTACCCDRPGATLLAAMRGAHGVILIDAMRGGGVPGTIRKLTPDELEADPRALSSHGFGVAESLALGRALGETPASVMLYGVEIGDSATEDRLSPAVSAAIPELVQAIAWQL